MARKPGSSRKRRRGSRHDEASEAPSRGVPKGDSRHDERMALKDSAFAKFPHEVLVNILTCLLQREDAIVLHSPNARRWQNEVARLKLEWTRPDGFSLLSQEAFDGEKVKASPLLGILLVSRAFYYAGIEAFYGSNVLKFETATALATFLKTTDIDRRRCIKRIAVTMQWYLVQDRPRGKRIQRAQGTTIIHKTSCDTDERTLRTDHFEQVPNLKSLVVYVHRQYHQLWPEYNDEIRERLGTAWPSVGSNMNIIFMQRF